MSQAALTAPRRSSGLPAVEVVVGLALCAGIAWLQPFDLLFAAATFGQPALRAGLIVALALTGARFARAVGLQPLGGGDRRGVVTAVIAAVAVAVACALIDRQFEPVLHPAYVRTLTGEPLALRTAGYMMRAVNENIIYRLFLGSALAWLIGRRWRDAAGRPAGGAMWCAFALSQAVNVAANVTLLAPVTPLALVHDTLRYLAPGMVWSWLYMRRGFMANELASTGVHLIFQPLAGLLLAA